MSKSVIVIGAGVVGLACAKELSNKGYEVFIAEQEQYIATGTSARNSGVIHAGIYYPTDSLKAKLCVRGKNLMYEYCEKFNVPHSNTKKMIVATTIEETQILLKLKGVCQYPYWQTFMTNNLKTKIMLVIYYLFLLLLNPSDDQSS